MTTFRYREREVGVEDVELPVRPVDADVAPAWGSDVIVDVLRALDVPYLPLNPGSSFRGLHDSVVNYGGNRAPQLLLCLHEEIAVSLANGWAKATGRLGVAAVHDLVGLMHASMAVYDAFCDRTPLLVLGGSGPADPALRRPIDWVHSANTQAGLVRDFVVWDAEPTTPQAFVSDTVRCAQRSMSVPKGPVYISLDAGVQEAELAEPVVMPDLRLRAPTPTIAAPAAAVEEAAELLAAAQRPVVVAGRVGLDPAATAVVTEVVELLGAAYRDARSTVVMPTTHPQNCTGDPELVREADVVLAIDVTDLNSLLRTQSKGARGSALAPAARPRVVDLSYGTLGLTSWSNVQAEAVDRDVHLLAEPLHGLRQLVEELRPRVDAGEQERRAAGVRERAGRLRQTQRQTLAEHWDDRPISQARLVAELWGAVRHVDHLLCLRNTRSWPDGIWEFAGSGTYLGAPTGGGVGYGPGALVGGALAARDRGQLGVGIIGDGDLMMAPGALWTAAHYRIPALVVVNDNSSFYNDEPHQAAVARQRGRPEENSWIGMRIDEPGVDIAGLARSYGCVGLGPVEDPDDLPGVLTDAVRQATQGATVVVHVRTARG
ncbi:MAG: thiamine pyrophosphate-binding protein [Nocardioidaceae bacterium]